MGAPVSRNVFLAPFLSAISSSREASLFPTILLIQFRTFLVYDDVLLMSAPSTVLDISVHWYTVLSVGSSHVISPGSLSRPIPSLIPSSSLLMIKWIPSLGFHFYYDGRRSRCDPFESGA